MATSGLMRRVLRSALVGWGPPRRRSQPARQRCHCTAGIAAVAGAQAGAVDCLFPGCTGANAEPASSMTAADRRLLAVPDRLDLRWQGGRGRHLGLARCDQLDAAGAEDDSGPRPGSSVPENICGCHDWRSEKE
jgi:hypothetical protein